MSMRTTIATTISARAGSAFHLKILEAMFIRLRDPLSADRGSLFLLCNCLQLAPRALIFGRCLLTSATDWLRLYFDM